MHSSVSERACVCRFCIAWEEQALLAVSAVLSTIRWLACEPCLQKGLLGSTSATEAAKKKPPPKAGVHDLLIKPESLGV